MTTAQLIFMYAAEELSISKAARRAFVSQQCASSHIRNLEEQYHAVLFIRKPVFSLTPAGICLRDYFQQLNILEQDITRNIAELQGDLGGSLRIGVNPTRARLLFDNILPRFSQEFSKVRISLSFGETLSMQKQLEEGKLDMIIGVNAAPFRHQQLLPLSSDSIYFITTKQQLLRYAPDILNQQTKEQAVSLSAISAFPLCCNLEDSTLMQLIDQKLTLRQTTLNKQYYIGDYDMQLSLCARNITSALFPTMLLPRIREYNPASEEGSDIRIFSIPEMKDSLQIDLIQNTSVFQPRYFLRMTELLREQCHQLRKISQSVITSQK